MWPQLAIIQRPRAELTKQRMHFGFAADARTQRGRGPSGGGFVDAKFLHKVIKKKKKDAYFFPDMMRT